MGPSAAGTTINQPPLADAGGPYSVTIVGTLQLDGSASTDPTYPWVTASPMPGT